jgi:plastocyanin
MQKFTTRRRSGLRRRWIAVAAVIATLAVIGVVTLTVRAELDPGEPVVGMTDVAIHDSEFGPAAIEVPAGTTVTWRWDGEAEHNVVGDGFESPTQVQGEFVYTFTEPGTYNYRCTHHFFMRGKVVVI